ncbi:MAG: hypothetical protein RJB66_899 [Pseudomonadota bacterium]
MKKTFSLLVFGVLSILSSLAHSAPAEVTIQSISTSGEGCPEGQTAVTIAPDQKSFSVLFDQLLTESNQQTPLSQKECYLTITSKVPAGWRYVFHADDYRGFAQSEKGSQSTLRLFYHWLNPKNRWVLIGKKQKQFNTNFNDNFTIHKDAKILQPQRHRCEEHLETVHIQIQMRSRSQTKMVTSSQMAIDSFDGRIEGLKQSCGY